MMGGGDAAGGLVGASIAIVGEGGGGRVAVGARGTTVAVGGATVAGGGTAVGGATVAVGGTAVAGLVSHPASTAARSRMSTEARLPDRRGVFMGIKWLSFARDEDGPRFSKLHA